MFLADLSPAMIAMLTLLAVAALSFVWLILHTRGQRNYNFFTLQGQILDKQWGTALPGMLFVASFMGVILAGVPLFWSFGWTWATVIWGLLSAFIVLNVWVNFRRGAALRKRKQEKASVDPYSAKAIIGQRRQANKRRKR